MGATGRQHVGNSIWETSRRQLQPHLGDRLKTTRHTWFLGGNWAETPRKPHGSGTEVEDNQTLTAWETTGGPHLVDKWKTRQQV